MPDNLTPEQRRRCMKSVRTADTDLERSLRSALHRRGLRFRKNVKGIPGSPDIVFARARVLVFVDGDFWHGYQFATWEHKLSEFWRTKITRNMERDREQTHKLVEDGWQVARFWQHEVKDDLDGCVRMVEEMVKRPTT